MLVRAGNPKRVFDLPGLCGRTVDVQKGTSQEAALQTQSQACKTIGLAEMKIVSFGTDADAYKNFESGKSDVHVTDYPVVAYLARTSGNKYEIAGRQFNVVPYGIVVAKNNAALRNRVQRALADLIADGTYDKLLQKWGLAQGALRSAPLNAGTLFEK
jgi:polar amino acid transport system substrate-binding protein